jgi:CO/xanthine dehydrogenase Mo-binding subunit
VEITDVAATGATRYAGRRMHRAEDARLLTGHGTYVDEGILKAARQAAAELGTGA